MDKLSVERQYIMCMNTTTFFVPGVAIPFEIQLKVRSIQNLKSTTVRVHNIPDRFIIGFVLAEL